MNIDVKPLKNISANRVHENIERITCHYLVEFTLGRRDLFNIQKFMYIIHWINRIKEVILSYREIHKKHLKTSNMG